MGTLPWSHPFLCGTPVKTFSSHSFYFKFEPFETYRLIFEVLSFVSSSDTKNWTLTDNIKKSHQ